MPYLLQARALIERVEQQSLLCKRERQRVFAGSWRRFEKILRALDRDPTPWEARGVRGTIGNWVGWRSAATEPP